MEFEAFLLPMSFAQQRLWFLDRVAPNRTLYNLCAFVPLEIAVDPSVLERSLNEIVRRHETLRTTFRSIDGQPTQIVAPELKVPLAFTDLRAFSDPAHEGRRLALEETAREFDLSRGPLLRPHLMRFGPAADCFVLTIHHIISDGWSMGVFMRELWTIYAAFCAGQSSPLPELPIQYGDFAVWQRDWLKGEVREKQLDYWKKQLAGVSLLQLPTDKPRPPVQTFNGGYFPFQLGTALAEEMRNLSRQEGATLFMTLLACFQVLLGRHSGQEDVVVGSPIAGRGRAETEGLIGFFVNSLVLRGNLSGDPTFREFLGRVRETALGAFAHQDVPFEMLVEQLQLQRDLSRNPIFQVMFQVFHIPPNGAPAVEEAPSMAEAPAKLEGNRGVAVFDLGLHLWDDTRTTHGGFEYSTDLFHPETIERLATRYKVLLAAAVADPDQRISRLPVLGRAERHQIEVAWNDTAREFPLERCVHHSVEDQVERTPDGIAVISGDSEITFRELNRRANGLARRLMEMGVRPDVPVAIAMERSIEIVVAKLATLKAGGAYVPADPSYPAERLAYMLQDSQAPVLLTQSRLLSRLPDFPGQVISLDLEQPEGEDENPAAPVGPDHLAYIIYTSGSTGKPKGVMITHRGLTNHMCWMQTDFPLTPEDRVLQRAPISFDASVWEYWAPLISGARLIQAPPGVHLDATLLAHTIRSYGITRLQLVPSQFRHLLLEPEFAGCTSLRHIFCGGEALPAELGHRLSRILKTQLLNLYGPTEVTIEATYATFDPAEPGEFVPIGRPLANFQCRVLDRNFQLLPHGVAGELFLGGTGLARGYLNNPELTAEKFVHLEPWGRLYRTGDLVRYRADGVLEYLGRIDHQVKIRGVRVELGEIEAVLRQHHAVRDTVVVAADDPGGKRLVAYVVPSNGAIPGSDELRVFLQQQLMEQMIPSQFVSLEALPLMPNGKVDRGRLPAPGALERAPAAFTPPKTELEQQIGAVWQEVLGVDKVGLEDNFFDLGGESLLMIQMQTKLEERLGIRISIVDLFRYPTVSALARQLAGQPATGPAVRQGRQRGEKQRETINRRRAERVRGAGR